MNVREHLSWWSPSFSNHVRSPALILVGNETARTDFGAMAAMYLEIGDVVQCLAEPKPW